MIWRNIFHFSTHLIPKLLQIIQKTSLKPLIINFDPIFLEFVNCEFCVRTFMSEEILAASFKRDFLAEDVKTSSFRLVMIYYWMQDFLDSVKVIWPHDGSKTTNFLCENFCPWSSFYQRTFMFASWYLHFPMWTCSRVKCKFKDVSSSLMISKHMFTSLCLSRLSRDFSRNLCFWR